MSAKVEVLRVLAGSAEPLTAAEVRELVDEDQATGKSVGVALSVLKAEGKIIAMDGYPAKYTLAKGVAKTLPKEPALRISSHSPVPSTDSEDVADPQVDGGEPAPVLTPTTCLGSGEIAISVPIGMAVSPEDLAKKLVGQISSDWPSQPFESPPPARATSYRPTLRALEVGQPPELTPNDAIAIKLQAITQLILTWPSADLPKGLGAMVASVSAELP